MSKDYLKNPLQESQNIFFGVCVDNNDPLMLGRIRIYPTQLNIDETIKSVDNFDENSSTPNTNGPWSDLDPFIYLPLLPYFINQVPKKGEYVMLFYFNNKNQVGRNKFYTMSVFSHPSTIKEENYLSSQTNLSSGFRNSKKFFPNLKDSEGKLLFPNSKGVFVEPVDITINGRDTTDLILKDDEVLLRAGKHKDFSPGQIPQKNDERAFIQLTRFRTKKKYGDPVKKIRLVENSVPIKYLIEYDVFNPENLASAFTGSINIFKITSDETSNKILTTNIKYNSDLSKINKSKIRVINFQSLNLEDLKNLINQTLLSFKDSPKDVLLNPIKQGDQFPFFYRPEKSIRDIIFNISGDTNPQSLNAMNNMSQLKNGVKIVRNVVDSGYSLVLDKKVSPLIPFKPTQEIIVPVKSEKADNTVGLVGANQLFLLSHSSVIPGKGKIDINDTLYGIDLDKISDEIEPKTSSMVRGEELMKLIGLIVNFLTSHDHPLPGPPPAPTSQDGTRVDEILSELQQAYEKILNQNIRLN
jgi:hypothetical protein